MEPELKTFQFLALGVLFVLIYAGRFVKGSPRVTDEGLTFPMKPVVLWGRVLVLPIYLGVFLFPVWQQTHKVPLWLPVMILAVVFIVASQMPGTIVFTPAGLVQRFWLRKEKTIPYRDVMSVQAVGYRMTRVLGNNRTTITHNWNICAADEFKAELERRTGKRVAR